MLGRYTGSGVGDGATESLVLSVQRNLHAIAGPAILDRVVQEVEQDLPQAVWVAENVGQRRVGAQREGDFGVLGLRSHLGDGLLGQGQQVHGALLHLGAGFQPSQLEHIVDQACHALRLCLEQPQRALPDRWREVVQEQDLEVGEDGGQRGAQLMGQVAEQPAGGLLGATLCGDVQHQDHVQVLPGRDPPADDLAGWEGDVAVATR